MKAWFFGCARCGRLTSRDTFCEDCDPALRGGRHLGRPGRVVARGRGRDLTAGGSKAS